MVEDGAWSTWGVRLIAVLSVTLAICLGWGWIEAFYRHVFVNSQLSSSGLDLPRPSGIYLHEKFVPIVGKHFFGDFQLPLVYARDLRHGVSPYLIRPYIASHPLQIHAPGRRFPEQYPPFAQLLFLPFTFLAVRWATVSYLLVSAAVFLVPLWLMLAPLRRAYRVIFLGPIAVLTTPFVSFLDRGNDIGIAVGLIAWSIWAWRKERWVLCGVLLAAAIALKVYPATVLVVPLALRRYRFTFLVTASAFVVNLFPVVFFPGSPGRNVRAGLSALESFKASIHSVAKVSWSLYSVIPNTAGLLFGHAAGNHLLVPKGLVDWLPSFLYLCGVFFVIRRGRIPQWCWGPLALATIQLCVPLNFVYTTAWAPIAAVWFAWGYLIDGSERAFARETSQWLVLRVLLLTSLVVTLTPSVFTISGSGHFTTPVARWLSPMLLFVTLCAAVVCSLRLGEYQGRVARLITSPAGNGTSRSTDAPTTTSDSAQLPGSSTSNSVTHSGREPSSTGPSSE